MTNKLRFHGNGRNSENDAVFLYGHSRVPVCFCKETNKLNL